MGRCIHFHIYFISSYTCEYVYIHIKIVPAFIAAQHKDVRQRSQPQIRDKDRMKLCEISCRRLGSLLGAHPSGSLSEFFYERKKHHLKTIAAHLFVVKFVCLQVSLSRNSVACTREANMSLSKVSFEYCQRLSCRPRMHCKWPITFAGFQCNSAGWTGPCWHSLHSISVH